MSSKKTHTHRTKVIRSLTFGVACLLASFVLGVQTAGEVEPVEQGNATELQAALTAALPSETGDINGDGDIDLSDAITILESLEGSGMITADHLAADPNGDHRLTVEDALHILRSLTTR